MLSACRLKKWDKHKKIGFDVKKECFGKYSGCMGKNHVVWMIDPFTRELEGKDCWCWLCPNCAQQRVNDT